MDRHLAAAEKMFVRCRASEEFACSVATEGGTKGYWDFWKETHGPTSSLDKEPGKPNGEGVPYESRDACCL